MILQPVGRGSGAGGSQELDAVCTAGDLVGRAVYVSGPKIGGAYQVRTVDIDSSLVEPSIAVGVIKSKPTSTSCIVHLIGPLSLPQFSGLSPGRRAFVGTSGKVLDAPPPEPASGQIRKLQRIGYVFADGTVMVNPEEPIEMRAA